MEEVLVLLCGDEPFLLATPPSFKGLLQSLLLLFASDNLFISKTSFLSFKEDSFPKEISVFRCRDDFFLQASFFAPATSLVPFDGNSFLGEVLVLRCGDDLFSVVTTPL